MDDIEEAHNLACQNGEKLFKHPEHGLLVMTSDYLSSRKKCCGNRCLFCVFGHENVKDHSCDQKECRYVTHRMKKM